MSSELLYNQTNISLPTNITAINDSVLCNYNNHTHISLIQNIEIPNTVTSIGNDCFEYLDYLASISLPTGLQSIGNYSFSNANLTEVEIPDSVKYIGEGTFYYNDNLLKVILGTGLESIGEYAFFHYSSSIQTIVCKAINPPIMNSKYGYYAFTRYGSKPASITSVYVPDNSVNTYKTATGWKIFSSVIKPISQYTS